MQIETKEQYSAAMDRIYTLLQLFLEKGSPEEAELKKLTEVVEAYEQRQESLSE